MKTKIESKKYLQFDEQDLEAVNIVMENLYGDRTMSFILDNERYYLPLLSAYGKIAHSEVYGVQFTHEEKHAMCDTLRLAYNHGGYDEELKARIKPILEAIFYQDEEGRP